MKIFTTSLYQKELLEVILKHEGKIFKSSYTPDGTICIDIVCNAATLHSLLGNWRAAIESLKTKALYAE